MSTPRTFLFLISLLIVLHGVLSHHQAVVHGARPVINLCHVGYNREPLPVRTANLAHILFTAEYYGAQFPELDFNWTLLERNLNTNSRDVVYSILTSPVDCDGFVGPATSPSSIAASPIIDKLWLSPTASSTQLSDVGPYPTFSRLIATDDVAGQAMASAVFSLGISESIAIATDDAYGRSVVSGFAKAFRALDGVVAQQTFVLSSYESIYNALREVRDRSRIKVIVASTLAAQHFGAAVLALGMLETHMFLFSESICNEANVDIQRMPSAWCVQYAPNRTAVTEHVAEFQKRPAARWTEYFAPYGHAPFGAGLLAHYFYLNIDSTRMLMHAFQRLWVESGRNETIFRQNRSTEAAFRVLRNTTFKGLTGTVALSENGDRVGTPVAIYNLDKNGKLNEIAVWDSFTGVQRTAGAPQPIWFNRYASSDTPAQFISANEEEKAGAVLWLGLGLGLTLFIILVGVVLVLLRSKYQQRERVKNAPQKPPLVLIFTDVESSTMLWEQYSDQMAVAMETHHRIIREVMEEFKAYEVKTIGDAFMIAVSNLIDATLLCLEIQTRLNEAEWPAELKYWKSKSRNDPTKADDPLARADGRSDDELFKGLRVRMGLHYCTEVEAKMDDVHQRFDYYGPDVNLASRVQSVAHGGQITCSTETLSVLLNDPDFDTIEEAFQGKLVSHGVALKGCAEPVPMMQLLPTSLKERQFEPIEGAPEESEAPADSELISMVSEGEGHDADGHRATVSKTLDLVLDSFPDHKAKSLFIAQLTNYMSLDQALQKLTWQRRVRMVKKAVLQWQDGEEGNRSATSLKDGRASTGDRASDDPKVLSRKRSDRRRSMNRSLTRALPVPPPPPGSGGEIDGEPKSPVPAEDLPGEVAEAVEQAPASSMTM